jgi:hypothetical protein
MDNMTRPIGDTFRLTEFHPGLPETIAILVVEESLGCKGCYVRGKCHQDRIKGVVGLCSGGFREDKKSVVFRKIKYIP